MAEWDQNPGKLDSKYHVITPEVTPRPTKEPYTLHNCSSVCARCTVFEVGSQASRSDIWRGHWQTLRWRQWPTRSWFWVVGWEGSRSRAAFHRWSTVSKAAWKWAQRREAWVGLVACRLLPKDWAIRKQDYREKRGLRGSSSPILYHQQGCCSICSPSLWESEWCLLLDLALF